MTAAAQAVPLDPDLSRHPDADRKRQRLYIVKKLAEGSLHPARRRLLESELRKLERVGDSGLID